jgi:hypothetical protein
MNGTDRDTINEPVVVTFKQRDRWSRLIARDPRVKLMHRHVLRSLALCARLDGNGRLVFDPTYAKLAKAARCHRATAIRAIDVAMEIGVVRKTRHSDGRVSNAFELLVPEAGSNGRKFPVATVANLDAPMVANLPVTADANGRTAATVLRLRERKQVSKKESKSAPPARGSADDDRLSIAGNSADDARPNPAFNSDLAEPLTPIQRAPSDGALTDTAYDQPSDRDYHATAMGRPANAANGYDEVRRVRFENAKLAYPEEHIGDEAEAYDAFCATTGGRPLSNIIEDIAQFVRERGPKLPSFADALALIARELEEPADAGARGAAP